MSEAKPAFPRLLQAVMDGTATTEQHQRLAELLRTNATLRAEYVQQMRLDALLHFTGGAVAQKTSPEHAAHAAAVTPRGNVSRFFPIRFMAAIAAILVLGVSVLWWSRRGVEVEVVRTTEIASSAWRPGTKVRLNRFSLPRGSVEFQLSSGVRLEVMAPAELQFVNAMHVRVSLGQVTADVGDRGKGFVVDTAQTQIVDLGTKFGVAVPNSGHTDVVVFQGEVELFKRKSKRQTDAPMTRLVEGEAVRVDAQQQMSRIMNVTSGPHDKDWSTLGSETGAVITSVHDNLRAPTELYYYRILAGGLREDAQAFAAKRHEWNGLDAAGLPAELLGADLVQTIPSDRHNTQLEIVVTVARPAVIYVFADSRTEPPAWLVQNFTATGALIGLENAPLLGSGKEVGRGPGEGNMAPFAVWKRTLPDGGAIELGPPGVATGEIRQWMYGIAAKAL